ncbi:MAG: hypothetical protein AAFR74_01400 [Pseudomonadota bacterium]
MKKVLLAGVFVLPLLSACTITRTAALSVEEGAKEECREYAVSGSLIPDRVCNNKATWAEIDERERDSANEELEEYRTRGTQNYQRENTRSF